MRFCSPRRTQKSFFIISLHSATQNPVAVPRTVCSFLSHHRLRPSISNLSPQRGPAEPVFGKKTRPGTPIADVIGGTYTGDRPERASSAGPVRRHKKIVHTKASHGHREAARLRREALEGGGVPEKVHFKMSKFANVKPSFVLPGTKRVGRR